MKAHWALSFVIVTALVSSMLPVSLSGNAQALVVSSHMIGSSGGSLTLDGAIFHLEGVNDQTVVPFQLYPYPAYHYRYSNHLFSSATGGYIGDTTTILNSDNMTDFWWQYFYLVHSLGLNCVRLGGFDWWGLSWLHSTYYNDRPTWDAVIDPMFAMAKETGVYIVFCFGGTTSNTYSFSKTTNEFGPSMQDPMAGSLFQVGSECYEHFVDWIGEVMNHYSSQVSLGMWEPLNEPDGDAAWTNYWSHLASPKESYRSWAENLTRDLNAIDHHHLLTIGSAVGGLMFTMNADTILANTNDADVCQSHVYGETRIGHGYGCVFGETGNESTFAAGRVETAAIGKPDFFGEVGYASVSPPWVMRYWPFLHNICIKYDINLCWLTLDTYPGYPISQERLASIPGSPTEPVGLAMAQDGDYTYELSGSPTVATISGYTGDGGAIVIPSTLGGYATVAIGSYAFQSKTSLTSVTIPSSVISIGQGAFSSCTALASVTIPNGVTTIGNYALQSCTSLTSVTIPSSVISIGGGAFYYCTSLASVTIGSGVTFIEGGAFCYCTSLASLSIPSTVTSFGDEAFSGCTALASVAISNSVTSIGKNAFQSCTSLTAISVDSGNPNYASVGGVLYNKAVTVLIQCPGGKAGAITIPNGVTTIGNYAFQSCISLTSVTIPNSVISVGYFAFSYCISLTAINVDAGNPNYASVDDVLYNKAINTLIQYPGGRAGAVTIPNGVTTIGNYAFQFCTSLTSLNIPSSVSSIGGLAFHYCTALTSITFNGLVAPTIVGYGWILGADALIRGHAYAASNFPPPGDSFFNLTMGTVIPVAPVAPGAPTGLAATGGAGFVLLNWTAPTEAGNPGLTRYDVYRGTSSGIYGSPIGNVAAGTLTYNDTTVTPGTPFFYVVKAVNSAGSSPASNQVTGTATALPSVPSAPQDIAGSAGAGYVRLTWAAPASNGGGTITNYKVYRGTTSGGETLLVTVENILTFTDSSLTNGQPYYYRVSAVNVAGEGPLSNEASATPATVPTAPTLNSATAGNGQVVLAWTAAPSNGGAAITGYNLYRGATPGGEMFLASLGNILALTDTDLTNGQTYYYKISAVNSVGEGAQSNELSATPITEPTAPTLSSAMPGNAQVVLVWTSPSDSGGSSVTAYKVYRGTTSGGESLLATLGNVLTYTDISVTNDQTYYYKVSAVNSVGEGELSTEASAAPGAVPSAPRGLQAIARDSAVDLNWTAPEYIGPGTLTCHLFRNGSEVWSGTGLTYTDTSVMNGITYSYQVAAENLLGWGLNCTAVQATPMAGEITPTPPRNLVVMVGNENVTLNWEEPLYSNASAVVGYMISYGTSPDSMPNHIVYDPLSIVLEGLTKGQIYYFKVAAQNSAGWGPNSTIASATPFGVPSIPLNLTATPGNGNVTLNWTAPIYIDSPNVIYHIYRDLNLLPAWSGTALIWKDEGLVKGVFYHYKVVASNNVGWGLNSSEVSATPFGVPDEPTGLHAIAGAGQIDLNWISPVYTGLGTITYHLFRDNALIWSGAEIMHTDTHLNKGQNFTYQVSASNSVGWGQNSTIISATPFGVPSVPIGLMAKSGDGYVTLNWSAPSYPGPSGLVYHLFRNGTMIWSGPLLAHNDSSVVNGVIYAYKVVAESLVGWGPNSSIVSAIPISPPILPGVPVGLQASVGDGQVTLSWTAPAHAGSSKILCYEVYWGTNSTSFVPSGTAFGTNCTITGVTNGHTYYYKVSAVNAAGEGNLTEAVSATPMAPTSNGSDLFVIVGGIAAVVVVAVIGGLFYLRRKK